MDHAYTDMTGALKESRDWETGDGDATTSNFVCLYPGCKSSGKIFKRSYELERHKLIHFPNKKLICPVYQCKQKKKGKFHTRNDKFREHIASHGELALFCCPIKECKSVRVKRAEFELHIADDHDVWERFNIKLLLDGLRIDCERGYKSCIMCETDASERFEGCWDLCDHLETSHSADDLVQHSHIIAGLIKSCPSYFFSRKSKLWRLARDFTKDMVASRTNKTIVSETSPRGDPTTPSAPSMDHDGKLWPIRSDKENDLFSVVNNSGCLVTQSKWFPGLILEQDGTVPNLMGEDLMIQQSLMYDRTLVTPQNFMLQNSVPQNFMPQNSMPQNFIPQSFITPQASAQLQSFIGTQEVLPMQVFMNPIPLVTAQTFNPPSVLYSQSMVPSFIPPDVSLDVNLLQHNQFWHSDQVQNQFNPHEQAGWVWQPSLVEYGNVGQQQNVGSSVPVAENMPYSPGTWPGMQFGEPNNNNIN